jgi:FtsH-binding integral membrane protein
MINSPIAGMLLNVMAMRFGWLLILGGFIILGRLASGLAASAASPSMQYAGLTLYVIAEAVIFAPIILIATQFSSPEVLPTATILTLLLFGGLTLVVFTTKKDFSFLRGILSIGFMLALGLIVCAVLFGFNLGLIFSFVMVLLASGAILYDTSRIMLHYRTDQYVAASLQLFASVALLFWYVLQIVMSFSRR